MLKRLSELFRAHLVMGISEIQTHPFSSMLCGYHIISTTMNALYSSLTIANHSYFHFLTLIVRQREAHRGSAAKFTEERTVQLSDLPA